jgi:hypothetical protein
VLWVVSSVLAAIACLSSLLLLWAALDSGNPGAIFGKLGLPQIPYPEVITMMYLKVSISDFLTLFSARTHNGFFWSDRPSPFLAGAAVLSLGISTLVACLWADGEIDGIRTRGLTRGDYKLWPLWVWIYCIIWWFIQVRAGVLLARRRRACGHTGACARIRSRCMPASLHQLCRSTIHTPWRHAAVSAAVTHHDTPPLPPPSANTRATGRVQGGVLHHPAPLQHFPDQHGRLRQRARRADVC